MTYLHTSKLVMTLTCYCIISISHTSISTSSNTTTQKYVLVKSGSWLFADKPMQGISIRNSRKIYPFIEATSFLLVGYSGDLAILENLSPSENAIHCFSSLKGTVSHLRLRLYVRKSSLLSTNTNTIEKTNNDGTQVKIHPGAILSPGKNHSYNIHTDKYDFVISDPEIDSGHSYCLLPQKSSPDKCNTFSLSSEALYFGSKTSICTRKSPCGTCDNVAICSIKNIDTTYSMVTLVDACGSYNLLAVDASVINIDRLLLPDIEFDNLEEDVSFYSVKGGVSAYWSDGSLAGTVRNQQIEYSMGTTKISLGNRDCFELESLELGFNKTPINNKIPLICIDSMYVKKTHNKK